MATHTTEIMVWNQSNKMLNFDRKTNEKMELSIDLSCFIELVHLTFLISKKRAPSASAVVYRILECYS